MGGVVLTAAVAKPEEPNLTCCLCLFYFGFRELGDKGGVEVYEGGGGEAGDLRKTSSLETKQSEGAGSRREGSRGPGFT